ncbi:hypothetical protein SAMN05445850_4535 [Paraburkholderia tuberum]|uniref:Uncharacterized protein n=1 Tax=Paraburkholderia tuberum TaxID=157910 RepID=A0A1H1JBG5_9BURK|nr:hypothetical protein SAMN05445850_4535 [Paraburkholderia tuberum]
MYTAIDLCLVLLLGLLVGASLGVIFGSIDRSTKQIERSKQFRVPAAHREFEHECDAHYPRIGD